MKRREDFPFPPGDVTPWLGAYHADRERTLAGFARTAQFPESCGGGIPRTLDPVSEGWPPSNTTGSGERTEAKASCPQDPITRANVEHSTDPAWKAQWLGEECK